MKRFLSLSNQFSVCVYGADSWSITINLKSQESIKFNLEILLLLYGHTDSATFKTEEKNTTLKFSVISDSSVEKSKVVKLKQDHFAINLIRNDAEFLVSYLLQYYRDEKASVKHIDIELSHVGDYGNDASLVIETENYQKPMSGEEARKILESMD